MEAEFGRFFLSGLGNKEVFPVGNAIRVQQHKQDQAQQHQQLEQQLEQEQGKQRQQLPVRFPRHTSKKTILAKRNAKRSTPVQTDDDRSSNLAEDQSSTRPASTDSSFEVNETRRGKRELSNGNEDVHSGSEIAKTNHNGQKRLKKKQGAVVQSHGAGRGRNPAAEEPHAMKLQRAVTSPAVGPENWQLIEPLAPIHPINDLAFEGLDELFDQHWDFIAAELCSSTSSKSPDRDGLSNRDGQICACLVQLPATYQGLQCRRSKCFDDRHRRYVTHGATVVGLIVDEGQWMQLSETAFLPTHIGSIQILKLLPSIVNVIQVYQRTEKTLQAWVDDGVRARKLQEANNERTGFFRWCSLQG